MTLSMPPMLADDEISAIVKFVVFVLFIVVTLIVKALQQQRKEADRQARRPMQDDEQRELPEFKPDAPPGQAQPRRLSVEDVALAMRRAQRERVQQQRQAARQAQAHSAQPAPTQIAHQRAAQLAAQQRAAHERALQQRAAQMRAAQQRQVAAQSPLAGQPLARPAARAATRQRQVREVEPVTTAQVAEATESVEQRHLHLSAVGQGVQAEETRMRGHIQEEDADRARRFSEDSLGRLHRPLAAVAAVRAVSAMGEMHLNTPAELGRAVLYAEIIGPPLALRDQKPAWEV